MAARRGRLLLWLVLGGLIALSPFAGPTVWRWVSLKKIPIPDTSTTVPGTILPIHLPYLPCCPSNRRNAFDPYAGETSSRAIPGREGLVAFRE